MIDNELRSRGVGASEVAAVLNLDPRRDPFAVYIDKIGQAPREDNPTERMKRGKRFERAIASWYGDLTTQPVVWFDKTLQHPTRTWQIVTPDAFVVRRYGSEEILDRDLELQLERIGGVDAKTAGIGAWDEWGESGSDIVPERAALQCQYTCSALDLPWWDLACAFSLDELRIYRIHRDPAIEAMLLEAVEDFWVNHVLARVPPRPGASDATKDALRRLYPKNVQPLRAATETESPLIESFKAAYQDEKRAARVLAEARNQLIYAIGEAEGLLAGPEKLTYKRSKDSVGVAWEQVARELGLRLELLKPVVEWALLNASIHHDDRNAIMLSENFSADVGALKAVARNGTALSLPGWWDQDFEQLAAEHQGVTREGVRKLIVPRAWGSEE
jgi:hypothetical protein